MNSKELREKLMLSQDGFAAKIGAAPFTVRRWEKGIHEPNRAYRSKIKEVFGIEYQ